MNNGLTLNPSKSEAIRFVSLRSTESVLKTVSVVGTPIEMSVEIKSLGVVFDKKLTFDKHVAACAAAAIFISVYSATCVRHSQRNWQKLPLVQLSARAWIIVTLTNFDKLQRVQNRLARVITGTSRFDHITPVLEGLHWLPFKSRVSFQLATLAFKTRQSGEPGYLASLLQPYQPTRELPFIIERSAGPDHYKNSDRV